jgi:hypothetical protein
MSGKAGFHQKDSREINIYSMKHIKSFTELNESSFNPIKYEITVKYDTTLPKEARDVIEGNFKQLDIEFKNEASSNDKTVTEIWTFECDRPDWIREVFKNMIEKLNSEYKQKGIVFYLGESKNPQKYKKD